MRVRSLKVKNFCQHADRHDVFCNGVTGIIGANGSGKSNYLNALRFALTGFNNSLGKKEDDLRWGCEDGYVALEFEIGSQAGTIKRQLKSSRCELIFGDDKFTSASEIEEVIYKIIGVPSRVLTDMVFVRQGQLEGILFQKPSERAKSFQALFGTESAQSIRDLLHESTQGLSLESPAEQIATTQEDLKQINERIKSLEDEAKAISANWLAPAVQGQLSDELNSHVRYENNARENERLQKERLSLIAEQDALQAQVTATQAALAVMDEALAALEPDFALASAELKEHAHRERMHAQIEEARKTKEQCEEWLKLPPPVRPDNDDVIESLTKEIKELTAQLEYSERATKLQAGDTCSTCLQPVASGHVEFHTDNIQRIQDHLYQPRNMLSFFLEERRQYEEAQKDYNYKHFQVTNRLQVATKLLSEQATSPLRFSCEEATAIVSSYDESLKSRLAALSGHKVVEAKLEGLLKRIAAVDLQLARLSDSGKALPPERVSEITALLEASKQAEQRLLFCKGFCMQAEETRKSLEARLAALQQQDKKLAPSRKWVGLVEKARAVLHHDALPRIVAQSYTRALNAKLVQYLGMFGVPFLARLEPDLSITVNFDGREFPAHRLSGGQKVMLSIAFRFAVHDIFASNLQLLVMDEPTVWLDTDRIDAVFDLLMKVKSHTVSSGLQVLIVTHEPRLLGAFDQTIKL